RRRSLPRVRASAAALSSGPIRSSGAAPAPARRRPRRAAASGPRGRPKGRGSGCRRTSSDHTFEPSRSPAVAETEDAIEPGRPAPLWYSCGVDTGSGDVVELLARVPAFSTLERDHLERIAQVAVPRTFESGQAVFREGDASDTCYVVRDGHA